MDHRVATARPLLIALISILVLSGCASPGSSDEPTADAAGAQAPAVSTEDLVQAYAGVGIATVDADGKPVRDVDGTVSPYRVGELHAQVGAAGVSARNGVAASQLDGLTTLPRLPEARSSIPVSAVVAAWLLEVDTPAAELAREYLGPQDLRSFETLVFPTAVLDLFLADVLPRDGDPALSPMSATVPQDAQSVCQGFSQLVEGTIRSVFDAIGKLPHVEIKSSSVLNGIVNGLITLANLGLEAAQAVVLKGVDLLVKPLMDLIASVASVVAMVTTAVNIIRPWSVEVLPEPTAVPVLGTSAVEGRWRLRATSFGPQEWPAQVKGCAEWAKIKLPSLRPADAELLWRVDYQNPKPLVQTRLTATSAKLAGDGTSDFGWATLVEPPDVASGPAANDGSVRAWVRVHRTDVKQLEDTLLQELRNLLPALLPKEVGGLLIDVVRPHVRAALDKLGSVRDVAAYGFLFPVYHVPDEEETPPPSPPTTPPSPSPSPQPAGGAFCTKFKQMLAWRTGSALDFRSKAAHQVVLMKQMLPLGTAQQQADSAVLIQIWGLWSKMDMTSPTLNPGAIGQELVRLGYEQAATRVGQSCGVPLAHIGAG